MTRIARPPRSDAAIAAALSERFRAGAIYSYSYDDGRWSTWTSEHDWLHTERNGAYRCSCCAPEMSMQHGPRDWARADLVAWLDLAPAPRKLTRAQLVARLRAIADQLPPAAIELVESAA
jgi:hypothetical protein